MEAFFKHPLFWGILAFIIYKLFKLYKKPAVKVASKNQDYVSRSSKEIEKPDFKRSKEPMKKTKKETASAFEMFWFLIRLHRNIRMIKRLYNLTAPSLKKLSFLGEVSKDIQKMKNLLK